MKVESPDRKADRTTLWAGLVANLAMFPGLGTMLTGQKSGLFQMILTLVADLTLLTAWVWWYLSKGILEHDWSMGWGPHRSWVIAALILRTAVWVWSASISVRMVRLKKDSDLPPVIPFSDEPPSETSR